MDGMPDIDARLRRADPAASLGDRDDDAAMALWRTTPRVPVRRLPRRSTIAIAGGIVALGTAAAAIAPTLVPTIWGDAGYIEVMPFELDDGLGSCTIALVVLEASLDGEITADDQTLPGGTSDDVDYTMGGTWEGFAIGEDESHLSHDEFVAAAEWATEQDWAPTMATALESAVADPALLDENVSQFSDETWAALMRAEAAGFALLETIDTALDEQSLNAQDSAVLSFDIACAVTDAP